MICTTPMQEIEGEGSFLSPASLGMVLSTNVVQSRKTDV